MIMYNGGDYDVDSMSMVLIIMMKMVIDDNDKYGDVMILMMVMNIQSIDLGPIS